MTISKSAQMAAEWWTSRLTQGDKEVFRSTLEKLIQTDLDTSGRCWLSVDYDPEEHLLTAVRAAGVECRGYMFSAEGILPMKHCLWVYPDCLKPKEGYGNWSDTIPVNT